MGIGLGIANQKLIELRTTLRNKIRPSLGYSGTVGIMIGLGPTYVNILF